MRIVFVKEEVLDAIWNKLQPQQRYRMDLACPNIHFPNRSTLVIAEGYTTEHKYECSDLRDFSLGQFQEYLKALPIGA